MFATTGLPVIWHLYRQPMALAAVRATLVATFLVTQMLAHGACHRLGRGDAGALLVSAAGAAPAVLPDIWIARHYPPPVQPATIRKAALALLLLSGVSLIAPAFSRLA
ncbi:MAG: hypothetical protein Q4G26_08050 [Paracoccus sp. (in: a-proteobacteria)]|nr:hypothetical protein [Paracoccus sp. (in: a-proteobacteria)]